ncbi:hypothetical protein [Actinoplanes sp. NPDC020271]|uniref:hypothetical protein n=1 Tax=Actinoplanes sp. NPDC020271 TaxID=3363896 RepID=UPI00379D8D49
MSRLEEHLRTTLRDRAADSAPQPDLWASVTDRVRRDQRRRRGIIAVAAALVVGAAGVTIPLVSRDDHHRPVTPVVHESDGWAPPAWPEPTFPMQLTWVPGDAGTRGVAQVGVNVRLEYTDGESILSAEFGPLQAGWETEAEHTHSTTVSGLTAEVHTSSQYDGSGPGDQYVGIRWQRPDGKWVTVLSWGPRSESEVRRFAGGLKDTGTVPAGKPPFTLATVPPGLTLDQQADGMMCLAPPDVVVMQRTGNSPLCVSFEDPAEVDLEPPMENLTINGRPAVYYDELHQIVITWNPSQALIITWSSLPLTRDDAIRFATGVS